jgi:hypothetical protein
MVKTALVGPEIERGSKLIASLDDAKTKVDVALWVVLPEYEDWRIVVASRYFDKLDLREAYGLLHNAEIAAGFTPYNTPPIMILPMSDSTIKDLRRRFAKAGNVEGMRPGGQMIGNRFIEDGYVYRIS